MIDTEMLTEERAILELRNFFRGKPFIFFGTGVSCALDPLFGMAALKDALNEQIPTRRLTGDQEVEWRAAYSALQSGVDLETALNAVANQTLLEIITEITGSFIADLDKRYAHRISSGESDWPATGLIKKLVDTLPDGDRILHALTPNYDMLFEYACDFAGIPYTNGLFGGLERRQDWRAIDRALLEPELVRQGRKLKTVYRHKRHVRLYKVHGSLNYFFHRNAVIENDAWMWSPPHFAERVMITPGLSKYQTLQRYRQELLKSADAAIDGASHFLFLGYGFNDSHLEEYIKRKLIRQASHGLIVTRDSNPRIESLLSQSDNLWLVCKTDGGDMDGTRVFNRKYSHWLTFPGKHFWKIGEFTARILGD